MFLVPGSCTRWERVDDEGARFAFGFPFVGSDVVQTHADTFGNDEGGGRGSGKRCRLATLIMLCRWPLFTLAGVRRSPGSIPKPLVVTTPLPPILKVSKSVQKAAGSEGRDAKDMQDHWSVRYRLALLRKVSRTREGNGGGVLWTKRRRKCTCVKAVQFEMQTALVLGGAYIDAVARRKRARGTAARTAFSTEYGAWWRPGRRANAYHTAICGTGREERAGGMGEAGCRQYGLKDRPSLQ